MLLKSERQETSFLVIYLILFKLKKHIIRTYNMHTELFQMFQCMFGDSLFNAIKDFSIRNSFIRLNLFVIRNSLIILCITLRCMP